MGVTGTFESLLPVEASNEGWILVYWSIYSIYTSAFVNSVRHCCMRVPSPLSPFAAAPFFFGPTGWFVLVGECAHAPTAGRVSSWCWYDCRRTGFQFRWGRGFFSRNSRDISSSSTAAASRPQRRRLCSNKMAVEPDNPTFVLTVLGDLHLDPA